MSSVDQLRRVAAELHRGGLNAGTAGNLSVRLGDSAMLITRRRTRKADLTAEDFVAVEFGRDNQEASTEFRLHVACYEADPAIKCVVHIHPPALTALGIRRSSFPPLLPELEQVVGRVDIVPFAPSGSDELAQAAGRAVARGAGVVILKRHGVVVGGESPDIVLDRLELSELAARTVLLASH